MWVKSDIMDELDQGRFVILLLLDQSAAFDIVNHNILLERMQKTYGTCGKALAWFQSYLSRRKQSVYIDGVSSDKHIQTTGVSQGSVLGPKLFSMYTRSLGDFISSCGFQYHLYAEDVQVYMSLSAKGTSNDLNANIRGLLDDISDWMVQSQLKLNNSKTEVIAFSSKHNEKHVKDLSIQIGHVTVPLESVVRDLGIYLDTCLTMEDHVNRVARTCYMHLRNISKIRSFLTVNALKSLVASMVMSRLDYGNTLLCGVSNSLINKMHQIQNYAARLITGASTLEHITPLLISLHWLPIRYRINYKVLVFVYQAIHGSAPSYIQEMVNIYHPSRSVRSESELLLRVPRSKTVTYGGNSFRTLAPTLWNSLPSFVRNSQSLSIFKKSLKTHLFKMEYEYLLSHDAFNYFYSFF